MILKISTLLLMAYGVTAKAEIDGSEINGVGVWRSIVGVGPNQSAELILDNWKCQKPATVKVVATDKMGLITHEATHIVLQGSGTVIPVPIPYPVPGLVDRRYSGIEVRVEPGPCAGVLESALVIINRDDGSTANVEHTRDLPDLNVYDPGISAVEASQNNYNYASLARIGPGQTAEFAFRNNCPNEISVKLRLSKIPPEEEDDIFPVRLAPSQIRVIVLSPSSPGPSIVFRALVDVEVEHRLEEANPCPPGLGSITGTLTLVNEQGNTTTASGLPTGKRQHKPVNLTKQI